MKEITSYHRAVQYLNKIFKHINTEFFNDSLEMPTITVQSTAEAYGHVTVGKGKEQTVPSQLAKRKTAISVGVAPAAIQLSEALRR